MARFLTKLLVRMCCGLLMLAALAPEVRCCCQISWGPIVLNRKLTSKQAPARACCCCCDQGTVKHSKPMSGWQGRPERKACQCWFSWNVAETRRQVFEPSTFQISQLAESQLIIPPAGRDPVKLLTDLHPPSSTALHQCAVFQSWQV